MLTATAPSPSGAASFVARAVLASLAAFGVLRLPWTEAAVVLPLTRLQAALGEWLVGRPSAPVEATLACSGADALALCVGAVIAYPARWPMRLAGAAGAVGVVLGLNAVRIGTLGLAAASPAAFNTLHLYVWPAMLTLSIAGYVLAWTHHVDRRGQRGLPHPSRRFVVLATAGLLLFSAASPLYLESGTVLALAGLIARAAGALLNLVGVNAHVSTNVLWTSQGGFAVTQECVATPLIPVYLAATCAYAPTGRRLIAGLLGTVPLFIVLGIVRLLVVAVPASVASPALLVHAFHQLVVGAVLVYLAARWRHGSQGALGPTLIGLASGALFVLALGPSYGRAVVDAAGAPLHDPQSAVAFLPAFQLGLYLALCAATAGAATWGRLVAGAGGLALTQLGGLFVLQALSLHAGVSAHVRDVRAWAVIGPVLVLAAVLHVGRTTR